MFFEIPGASQYLIPFTGKVYCTQLEGRVEVSRTPRWPSPASRKRPNGWTTPRPVQEMISKMIVSEGTGECGHIYFNGYLMVMTNIAMV